MHFLVLLPLFSILQICQAFVSPDIYSLTQPAGASADLGEDSQPPTVPSQSRLEERRHTVIVFLLTALQQTCSRSELRAEHLPTKL